MTKFERIMLDVLGVSIWVLMAFFVGGMIHVAVNV